VRIKTILYMACFIVGIANCYSQNSIEQAKLRKEWGEINSNLINSDYLMFLNKSLLNYEERLLFVFDNLASKNQLSGILDKINGSKLTDNDCGAISYSVSPSIKVQKNIQCQSQSEIDDSFKLIGSIFPIQHKMFFILRESFLSSNSKSNLNGLCCFNDSSWYDHITGTKFDILLEMGRNKNIGFRLNDPTKIVAFQNINSQYKERALPDFRFRQQIYKLDDEHFVFHNIRVSPSEGAIEVYNLKGERERVLFKVQQCPLVDDKAILKIGQTVAATDGRGCIYIAFRYSQNPYAVWKLNKDGKVMQTFSAIFEDTDEYEFPKYLSDGNWDIIVRNSIAKLYGVQRLLVDSKGNLLVFITRDKRKERTSLIDSTVQEDNFVDVFDAHGCYLGRKTFDYGKVEAIDENNIIYSKQLMLSDKWKIVKSKIVIN
jgi:hypothetical protein